MPFCHRAFGLPLQARVHDTKAAPSGTVFQTIFHSAGTALAELDSKHAIFYAPADHCRRRVFRFRAVTAARDPTSEALADAAAAELQKRRR